MSIVRSERSVSTKRSSRPGSVSGSSPWIFITRPNCLAFRATSAVRSVPLWCFGEVIATSAPQSNAALAIRMSSVAMMTASNFFARRQRSHTCRRSGLFAMTCNGFPGKRVDAHRAGMIPTALFICRLQNDFGGGRKIFGHPIRAAAVGHLVKASPNADRPDAGIMRALGVDLLVANEKRARKIDIMVACSLKDHSGRRFATLGRLTRRVGAKIGRVDQIISELARNFGLHHTILLLCEKAPADSTLIGDDDD